MSAAMAAGPGFPLRPAPLPVHAHVGAAVGVVPRAELGRMNAAMAAAARGGVFVAAIERADDLPDTAGADAHLARALPTQTAFHPWAQHVAPTGATSGKAGLGGGGEKSQRSERGR